jgi:hypothetical protein
LPQPPQLSGSREVSTHWLVHNTSDDGHETVHTPPTQNCPVAQTVPQAPQLCASLCLSVQTPPQNTSPLGQVHRPETQTCPGAQAAPQAPQFSRSS